MNTAFHQRREAKSLHQHTQRNTSEVHRICTRPKVKTLVSPSSPFLTALCFNIYRSLRVKEHKKREQRLDSHAARKRDRSEVQHFHSRHSP